jgi:hypothetical protein
MKNIKLLVATLLVTITASAQFTQKALPYAYNALEPFVDAANTWKCITANITQLMLKI